MTDPVKDPTETPPAATPPADQTPPDKKPGSGQTFTQEDLDRIVGERLERDRKKYGDYDELKKAADKLKKLEDAQKTDAEKTTQRVADLEKSDAEKGKLLKERTTRYEVMLAAQKLNIVDPDAAYRLLDLTTIEFDDEGLPKDVEKALKALLKARPYLEAKPKGNGPPETPKADGEHDKISDEERRKQAWKPMSL